MAQKQARIVGRDADSENVTELEHFGHCCVCGQVFDMRELGQVMQHWHDGPEMAETKKPPPRLRDGG
jgi:hypothetical protein